MSRLLVSVRDASEARAALAGGAHLIDIKEPTRGPLGAADVAVWREVIDAVAKHAPVSAALGELLDDSCRALAPHTTDLSLVKAGLAGCASQSDWPERLRALRLALPTQVRLAAVIYADTTSARAPAPDEILRVARELSLDTLLIDTYDKTHGDLFQHQSLAALTSIIKAARQANMQVAIAGSLTKETIPTALQLAPHWIAVRGAACQQGEREARVEAQRVAELARILQQMPQTI